MLKTPLYCFCLQYPEHHLVGFPGIDAQFRNIGTSLRLAVDLREEFMYALLQLQEGCGFEGRVGMAQCLATMCARASESDLKLKIAAQGEVHA